MTFDGLVPSGRRDLKNVWLKPGIDFSHYTGIIFEAPEFEFRLPGSVDDRRFRQEQFVLTPADKQGLSEMAIRIFTEEAQKIKHYRLIDRRSRSGCHHRPDTNTGHPEARSNGGGRSEYGCDAHALFDRGDAHSGSARFPERRDSRALGRPT